MRFHLLPGAATVVWLAVTPLTFNPAFAADAPPSAETIDISLVVGTRLNEVIALLDVGSFEEASAAMQVLRADLQEGMTDYERFVMLQISANLNTTLFKYAEAIADYEALLQLQVVTDEDRLKTSNLAGQLYLQLQDWNKGLELLLAVNEMQGGNDIETLFRLAFAHSQLGQPAAAIPYLEQALVVGGDQTPEDYFRNMALLYIQTQDTARAVATYEKLLELYPDVADREKLLANTAALYIELGNSARASSLLRTLMREYPGSDQMPVWRQSLDALTRA